MKFALALTLTSLGCSAALAHHSTQHYAREASELEGELVEIRWVNPHIMYTLKTTGSDGEEKLVRLESGSVYYLERTGFNRDTLQVGDRIIAGGRMSTRRDTDFLLNRVTLESGQVLSLSRDDLEARFQDKKVDAAGENKGIFRVWSIPPNNERDVFTSLNALAEEKKLQFDPLDNFSTRCEAAGMPRLMWFPHPYEFIDLGDQIQVNIAIYNQVRTIHMNQTATPADFAGSPLGYSVGRWEDSNTLVVTTTDINWGVYTNNGTPLSEQAIVTERYTLSEDQGRLDFHLHTTDPVYFDEPATVAAHWVAVGDKIEPYNCTLM